MRLPAQEVIPSTSGASALAVVLLVLGSMAIGCLWLLLAFRWFSAADEAVPQQNLLTNFEAFVADVVLIVGCVLWLVGVGMCAWAWSISRDQTDRSLRRVTIIAKWNVLLNLAAALVLVAIVQLSGWEIFASF